ncbi:hypothetical protein [Pseudomonas protegens]|uniref:hypothetical protein n=1 Tax=Pseudomonas protegens TaxID=380021 RepID=UPI001B316BC4|nr:hypothetical protein [Pseudomonas protegens]MBP5094786.1 hypothetical protein [Pseudomonas protegens]QTU08454.1 hypothetical protein HUT25_22805 [Pseudomonas protegens]QTU14763.1 hypothetical protein HUT23_23495 [Pseudomonas protegens]QTU37856.1 hypothetical protein HUT24_08810 [Pseudomonas protegens]
MKFDTAYCISLDDKLSIYDVRDLNFDETLVFDSARESFQCPNEECRAAFDSTNQLGTFNAKNVNYIRTPHFKNLPATLHMEGCPYGVSKSAGSVEGTATEEEREEHFPSELLLSRREYVRKPASPQAAVDAPQDTPQAATASSHKPHAGRDTTPEKTSVFAHPVECFVSNIDDKELLKRMPLKVGEHTASYASFFKKIEYLLDNKGLIYWGKIKEIKDYTQSFRIDFEQKVWFKAEGETKKKPYSVNVYLSKKLIDSYRKRKAFLEEIKGAADSQRELYCFFYGVTPALKQVPSKKDPESTFGVFSANIENLDHFVIREAPGLEAK